MITPAKAVARRFKKHNMMVSAAGVAFYGLLALAPTLLAMVSVYGLVTCDPDQIQAQVDELLPNMGGDGKEILIGMLEGSSGATEGGCDLPINGVDGSAGLGSAAREMVILVGGLLIALWSASGAVQKLLQTIAVAYEAVDARPGWKVRLLSYGFTAFLIVGFVILLAVLALLPNIVDRLPLSDGLRTLVNVGQFPLLALLFAGALTILYRYGPDRSPRTRWWNPGAIVGTLLFLLFAVALSLYSSVVGTMPASYGVIGSLAALMIFLQLTTIAVLIGAEVNGVIEEPSVIEETSVVDNPSLVEVDRVGSAGQSEPVGFIKALVGLVALFVLGRGGG